MVTPVVTIHDQSDRLAAGLSGVLAWQWLFVEALRVGDALA